jgi:cytochrome P450
MMLLLSLIFRGVVSIICGAIVYYLYDSWYTDKKTITPGYSANEVITVQKLQAYPVIGNIIPLLPSNIMAYFVGLSQKYGPNVIMELRWPLHVRAFVVRHPEIIDEILLKRPKSFRRPPRKLEYFRGLFGLEKALFFSSGNDWLRVRKLTSPSFSRLNVSGTVPLIWESTNQLAERLTAHCGTKTAVEFTKEAITHGLNVITNVAFITKRRSEAKEYFFSPNFQEDLKTFFACFMFSNMSKVEWFFIDRFSNLKPNATAAMNRMNAAARALVKQRKHELREENEPISNCLLDAMLRKEENTSGKESIITATTALSEEEFDQDIAANITQFYMAGAETTAMLICWSIYHLINSENDPEILKKARKEADAFCLQFNNKSVSPTFDDMEKGLKYIEAIIQESLRMEPPAPLLLVQGESKTEGVVLNCGLTLTPHDVVYLDLVSVSRNEKIFPKADVYLPERWLIENTNKEHLEKMADTVRPFGFGPRMCPGMNLALFEARLAVTQLIHSFDMELACTPAEVKRVLLGLRRPTPLPIKFSKRII